MLTPQSGIFFHYSALPGMKVGVRAAIAETQLVDPIGTKYGKGYNRKFVTDLPVGQDDCYYFDDLRQNQVIAVHYMVVHTI